SRPNSRISSTIRSSTASASLKFPSLFSIAPIIDANRSRRPGCALRLAQNRLVAECSGRHLLNSHPFPNPNLTPHHFESHPHKRLAIALGGIFGKHPYELGVAAFLPEVEHAKIHLAIELAADLLPLVVADLFVRDELVRQRTPGKHGDVPARS